MLKKLKNKLRHTILARNEEAFMLYKHQLKDNDVCPAISREVARLDEEVRQIVKEVDKINYIKFVRKCLKEVRPTVKEIDKINYIKFVRKCLEEV